MKEIHLKQNSDFHFFVVTIALKEYRNYQKFFEDFLQEEKESLEKTYDKYISEELYDNSNYSEFAELYFKKHEQIADSFPNSFRASFLIQIVSFIETTLIEICEHYELTNSTNYSVHDLKGSSDIEKAKTYLIKTCRANFNSFNPEWQFILLAKKVRNSLIHNQGSIKTGEKDWKLINDFNKGNGYFSFFPNYETEQKRIILRNKNFSDKLINSTEIFFKKLLQEVNY